jgi:hypothetical protein
MEKLKSFLSSIKAKLPDFSKLKAKLAASLPGIPEPVKTL